MVESLIQVSADRPETHFFTILYRAEVAYRLIGNSGARTIGLATRLVISIGEDAGGQAGDEKRRTTMKRGVRHSIVGGIAFMAAIALASTMASTSARADHTNPWDAALMGAVIGGLIGLAIDHESDHVTTVGTSVVLGSPHVGYHVSHRHHSWLYQRPMHHQRGWHDRRGHRAPWYVHPRRHRHGHHHHGYHRGWKRPHAHAPILMHPRPRDRNRHHRPVYGNNTHRDCRVLEHGARPVVACRGRGGHWHIIQ